MTRLGISRINTYFAMKALAILCCKFILLLAVRRWGIYYKCSGRVAVEVLAASKLPIRLFASKAVGSKVVSWL